MYVQAGRKVCGRMTSGVLWEGRCGRRWRWVARGLGIGR